MDAGGEGEGGLLEGGGERAGGRDREDRCGVGVFVEGRAVDCVGRRGRGEEEDRASISFKGGCLGWEPEVQLRIFEKVGGSIIGRTYDHGSSPDFSRARFL